MKWLKDAVVDTVKDISKGKDSKFAEWWELPLKDKLLHAVPTVADTILPEYPEGGTQEELNEYYENLYGNASIGGSLINYLGNPEEKGGTLTGDASLIANYLAGNTEDMPLFSSQEEIDNYLSLVHAKHGGAKYKSGTDYSKKGVWYDSTNPDFHADDGWQFLRYDPLLVQENRDKKQGMAEHIHNRLGRESIVRRRLNPETGQYEYQIVENWDPIKGDDMTYSQIYDSLKKMDIDWNDPRALYSAYRDLYQQSGWAGLYPNPREIPENLFDVAMQYSPDLWAPAQQTAMKYRKEFLEGNVPLQFLPDMEGLQYLMELEEQGKLGYPITGTSYFDK
tara:strand:- start:52 stop:1059 length:1008 start_codon:yes stop_codon:yes gene_type:complete